MIVPLSFRVSSNTIRGNDHIAAVVTVHKSTNAAMINQLACINIAAKISLNISCANHFISDEISAEAISFKNQNHTKKFTKVLTTTCSCHSTVSNLNTAPKTQSLLISFPASSAGITHAQDIKLSIVVYIEFRSSAHVLSQDCAKVVSGKKTYIHTKTTIHAYVYIKDDLRYFCIIEIIRCV